MENKNYSDMLAAIRVHIIMARARVCENPLPVLEKVHDQLVEYHDLFFKIRGILYPPIRFESTDTPVESMNHFAEIYNDMRGIQKLIDEFERKYYGR